jgi:hypothetical protein
MRTPERMGVAESVDLHAAWRMQTRGLVAGEDGSGTALALFPVSVTAVLVADLITNQ